MKLKLTTNVRISSQSWSKYLEKVGEDRFEDSEDILHKEIECVRVAENLLSRTFEDFLEDNDSALLTTRNDTCKTINEHIQNIYEVEERTYFSFTRYVENTNRVRGINQEFLDNYSNPNIPDSVIRLKVGALIMLTVNLNPANS